MYFWYRGDSSNSLYFVFSICSNKPLWLNKKYSYHLKTDFHHLEDELVLPVFSSTWFSQFSKVTNPNQKFILQSTYEHIVTSLDLHYEKIFAITQNLNDRKYWMYLIKVYNVEAVYLISSSQLFSSSNDLELMTIIFGSNTTRKNQSNCIFTNFNRM